MPTSPLLPADDPTAKPVESTPGCVAAGVSKAKRIREVPDLVETAMIDPNLKHPLAELDESKRQEHMVTTFAQVLTQIAQSTATQPAEQQKVTRAAKRPRRT